MYESFDGQICSAEISDNSAMTIPLPLSSILSLLASRTSVATPVDQFSSGEKVTDVADPLPDNSPFSVRSSREDPSGIDADNLASATNPSPQSVDHGTPLRAPPGAAFVPRSGTMSCSPVAGAKVVVTLVGTPYKTHIVDCITGENGDLSFYMPLSIEKSPSGMYTFNFEITAPGVNLPPESSKVVTDMADVSNGPLYTYNVCYQQPSEPDARAITRGGIAVIGRIIS